MSIIIYGMDMPQNGEGNELIVRVQPDGTVLNAQGIHLYAEAKEIPPHGRLIDADALLENMKKVHDRWKVEGHYTPTTDDEIMTIHAPTIIEAEGESE